MFSGYQDFIKSIKFIFTEYSNKKPWALGALSPL